MDLEGGGTHFAAAAIAVIPTAAVRARADTGVKVRGCTSCGCVRNGRWMDV